MDIINILRFSVFGTASLAAPAAIASLIVSAPIDVVGNLPLATFIGDNFATQKYKDWGNEPFVAVNPTNINDIVVSSFAFSTPTNPNAALFYSTNGGNNWTLQFSVPSPSANVGVPRDWTFAYDNAGTLHGAILGSDGNIYQGMTANPAGGPGAWSYTGGGSPINMASRGRADQPWVALQGGDVFVAYTGLLGGRDERVAVSNNNGTTFTMDNPIHNDGPHPGSVVSGERIATDAAGNVYSIFGVGSNISRGVNNVTYYLNRSRDGGTTWDFNPNSTIGGIIIDSGVSTQACFRTDQGGTCTQASNNWFAGVNNLLGNITAIAVDKTAAHVYALIGKQDANGTDRIYLAAFQHAGTNLVKASEIVISPAFQRAALPAITVKADGIVVMMYETFADDGKVHVHIASSSDFGASISSDIEEYGFTPLTLAQANPDNDGLPPPCVPSPTNGCPDREFGDYDFLTSIGDTFYGTFAGLGDVNAGGINTTNLIDPFFFSGTDAVPEPGTLLLVLTGLAGVMWVRVRPRICIR